MLSLDAQGCWEWIGGSFMRVIQRLEAPVLGVQFESLDVF